MAENFSFGYWLKRQRKARDMTQEQLAQLAGVATVTLRKIEADERRPSLQLVQHLAEIFGLDPDEGATLLRVARADLATDQLAVAAQPLGMPTAVPLLPTAPLPTGTVTFLFTDIEGSTKLWEQHPQAMRASLARHDALLRQAIEAQGGVVFKTTGDGVHAAFSHALEALAAALDAQRALQLEPWGAIGPVRVRMALHTGVAELRDDDYFGPPLNRVARLLAAGHGGQILLSAATQELVLDEVSPDTELRDLGAHRLKDLTRPEHIYQLITPDLPADFPPLATLDQYRTNLPIHPTPLIGRQQDVAEGCALLHRADVHLLTLSGPGGVGKTRLGVHVAAQLLDDFPNGVSFVNLAPIRDPDLVAAAIAQALGIKEAGGQPLVERLKQYLRDKQLLLVLDNFEQVLAAAMLVAELLGAALRLKVLVTSRIPLHLSGEHEFAVAPLSLPPRGNAPQRTASTAVGSTSENMTLDPAVAAVAELTQYAAVQLFIARAQAVKADFAVTNANAPAVAEICYQLDGLPLAIELAAARVKLFPPRALLTRLERRLTLLTAGARDLPARQQTIRTAIDWSYQLLDADEQRLFARLGVFVGGCALEAAEAVCTVEGDLGLDVLDGLAALVDQSLVRQDEGLDGEPRFTMLETIRAYALEQLTYSREMDVIRLQHAAYYLALAEEVEPKLQGAEQGVGLVRLETEHDNLRAALEWGKEDQAGVGYGLRLAAALWRFWEAHGHLSQGRAWLEGFLQARTGASADARARALTGAGVLTHRQGDYQRSIVLLEESVTLFRELGDSIGLTQALNSLALAIWFQGDHAAARGQLEESLALARTVENSWGIADALHLLGHVTLDQGNALEARSRFEESLALFRAMGDRWNCALLLKDVGLIACRQGDYTTAGTRYEESLALSREMDDTWDIAETLCRQGELARLQGDYARAIRLYTEGLSLWRELGNKGGIAEALNLLGEVVQLQHDHEQAKMLFEESLALYRELGNKRVLAGVLHNLGNVVLSQGEAVQAAALFAESLALNDETGYQPGIADCFVGLAGVAGAQGHPERAVRLLGAAEPYLDAIRGFMPVADRTAYDRTVAAVHTQLDQATFAAAWAEGQAMPLEQAIVYALDEGEQSARAS